MSNQKTLNLTRTAERCAAPSSAPCLASGAATGATSAFMVRTHAKNECYGALELNLPAQCKGARTQRGEPLFIASWLDALMIHFEVDAKALQRDVQFELDLLNGRAFVSLVAFTMRDMKPRFGGKIAALLFHPIATHHFLNVRTYVRHGNECGIHFLAEWLTNRLAVILGPSTFGLPYHYGHISYQRDLKKGPISGRIADPKARTALTFEARLTDPAVFQPCAAGSLDEWLMERYIAFNSANRLRRFFRVWHPPWPQQSAHAVLSKKSLLTSNWPWFN